MVTMTVSIPEVIYNEMQIHSELKWSAFEKKIKELHWADKVLAKSRLTETEADKISHSIKRGIRKRFQ